MSEQGRLVFEMEINDPYLQAELARIDIILRREISRWQAAGQDPQDAFRGLAVSDQDAVIIADLPFGANWGNLVALPAEVETAFSLELQKAEIRIHDLVDQAQSQSTQLRLIHLAQEFELDRFDLDTLLICLAPALDLRYERLYGYLQDDITRKRPTVHLILNLLCGPETSRLQLFSRFLSDSPLFHHHIIERLPEGGPGATNLLGQSLQVSPTVVSWLLGAYQPQAGMEGYFQLTAPEENETDQLMAAPLENLAGGPALLWRGEDAPILGFYGQDHAGQAAAARLCVSRLDGLMLQIDMEKAKAEHASLRDCLEIGLRDARLTQAVPFFSGVDAWLAPDRDPSAAERAGGQPQSNGILPPDILVELCDFPGLVIAAGQSAWQATGIERNKPIFWVEFPVPVYPQRRELWNFFLGTSELEDLDTMTLAGQFALNSGQIRDAVASARDIAVQANHGLRASDLFTAARLHSNSCLGGLARKVDPRYMWNDLILPGDQLQLLREIVSTVHCRPQVLEEWGVGQKLVPSAGIPILFSGPPGTGKTMAAEVIANELGLDLYKIELSGIVSKYIGETEKNLEKIFDEAEHSNAILFFDEADAIFGKRSEVKDAHDRYANIEISYLLQRMELYGGVTILATNLRANLDEAFTRRLQFAIDFPFPDEEHRLRIWKALFPASIPHDPNLDFQGLARSYKLAGGNIRNIIVGAAYLAAANGRVVLMDHLLHSVRRELQKMGRLVNEKDKKM